MLHPFCALEESFEFEVSLVAMSIPASPASHTNTIQIQNTPAVGCPTENNSLTVLFGL